MRYIFRGEKAGKAFRKTILGLITVAFVALAIYASLAGGFFRWKSDYPFSHPGSTWESEEPRIYLYVVDEIPDNGESFLVVDGKEISVKLGMDPYAKGVYITDSVTKEILLAGDCKFSSERVVIKVLQDHLYNGAYPEIILNRTDME